MKPNRIKNVLKSGGVALGFGVLTFSPGVIEVAGRAGVDFIWLDLEHSGISPYDSVSMENMVRTIENLGLVAIVRSPENNESMIGKILDAGVHSILVPGINSKDETIRMVAAAKYRTKGFSSVRGAPVSRASGWVAPDIAFVEGSDSQLMVGATIESKEGVQNLDEILSVNGLDYIFVGPADLSLSLGFPFETTHATVKEYIAKIRNSCLRKGMPVGIAAPDVEAAKNAISDGFRIIRIGVDLPMISKTLTSLVNEIRG
jgi:2-dehydro-3-deoxyglucarate aldolase